MILILWMGCGMAAMLTGVPSFSLMAPSGGIQAEPMGPAVTVEECNNSVLGLINWSAEAPSHEGVVAKALAQTGADVLLDAQLTTYTYNAYVFQKICTRVTGVPARLKGA